MAKEPVKEKPKCPGCGSSEIRYRKSDNSFWCRVCGHKWVK